MTTWLLAGFWGLFSGSALLLGALVGYFGKASQRSIAVIMAFGSGVLISTLTFELMETAYHRGGLTAVATGFVGGAIVYTFANLILAKYGAKHRKRSGFHKEHHMAKAADSEGNGMAIAVGALLDGIPESIVIGLSMLEGAGMGMVAVVAIFISNIPEGLSSSAGMKKAGYSKKYIFGIWIGIALISGLAAFVGCSVFSHFSNEVIAATIAVAAGAILAMLVDTMIPEAFGEAHNYAGLVTVLGFLVAFMLSMSN